MYAPITFTERKLSRSPLETTLRCSISPIESNVLGLRELGNSSHDLTEPGLSKCQNFIETRETGYEGGVSEPIFLMLFSRSLSL